MDKFGNGFQHGFLFAQLRKSWPVAVHMRDGRILHGRIFRFDTFSLVLRTKSDQDILIYKYGIESIRPEPDPQTAVSTAVETPQTTARR